MRAVKDLRIRIDGLEVKIDDIKNILLDVVRKLNASDVGRPKRNGRGRSVRTHTLKSQRTPEFIPTSSEEVTAQERKEAVDDEKEDKDESDEREETSVEAEESDAGDSEEETSVEAEESVAVDNEEETSNENDEGVAASEKCVEEETAVLQDELSRDVIDKGIAPLKQETAHDGHDMDDDMDEQKLLTDLIVEKENIFKKETPILECCLPKRKRQKSKYYCIPFTDPRPQKNVSETVNLFTIEITVEEWNTLKRWINEEENVEPRTVELWAKGVGHVDRAFFLDLID